MFDFLIGCSVRKVVKEDAIWSHCICFINGHVMLNLGIQSLVFSLSFSNQYNTN